MASGTVDVQIPAAGSDVIPTNPMAIVMNAAYIPDGTTVTVSIKTSGAQAATATATLTNGTATVNMTVPSGFSYIQASTGTFTISAELQQALPLFGGERILQAAVEFDGAQEHTYFYTESASGSVPRGCSIDIPYKCSV